MTEMYVALTDYLLTFFCLGFAWKIWSYRTENSVGNIWILFFLSIASASLLGGTVHGFFSNETTFYYKLLWIGTLLSIGITAACCYILGGYYLFKSKLMFGWILFVIFLYLIYAVIVLFFVRVYAVAIYNYLPAIIFLLIANIILFQKNKTVSCLWIIAGIITSFLAAYIQQSHFSLTTYVNYNSAYHLVQIIALFMIFKGVKIQLNAEGIE